jgi:MFS transporter, ACS family, allantoate permease
MINCSLDLRIMPLMCIIYGLQFLDKTTLSYANIMGLKTSTNTTGSQYSWLGSMFYFGYLVAEYPASRLMQRLPLAKYTGVNIIIWGTILACIAACTSWPGLMVVRTFLGIFEASITPGFALFTSQWYRKHEQGARIGLWFSFNGVAQIVGGLVAYGIATATSSGQTSLAGWQIMFLWTGLVTAAFGVMLLIFMPDNPLKARWLTPREKVFAIERIRMNQQGVGNRHFKKYQFFEALKDPLVNLPVSQSAKRQTNWSW